MFSNLKIQRIQSLDVLRGISILIVISGHYGALQFITNFISIKQVDDTIIFFRAIDGVFLFFLISGYFMGSIYEKTKSINFLKRRWLRLIPVFIIASLIAFVIELIFPEGLPKERLSTTTDYITTIIYACSFGLIRGELTQGAYWSLILEFRFYLLLCILIFFKISLRNSIFFLSTLSFSSLFLSHSGIQSLFASLPFFTIGMSCWRLWNKDVNIKEAYEFFYSVLVLFFICKIGVSTPSFPLNYQSTPVIGALLVIFFAFIKYQNSKILNNRILYPVVFFGLISYPLYIIHQETGMIIEFLLKNSFNEISFIFIEIFVIKLLISLILAALVHISLERKILSLKEK